MILCGARGLIAIGKTEKKSQEEAQALVDLAVGIVHTFATLLPNAAEQDRLIGRTGGIYNAIGVA